MPEKQRVWSLDIPSEGHASREELIKTVGKVFFPPFLETPSFVAKYQPESKTHL